jgi:hypothetical protein
MSDPLAEEIVSMMTAIEVAKRNGFLNGEQGRVFDGALLILREYRKRLKASPLPTMQTRSFHA